MLSSLHHITMFDCVTLLCCFYCVTTLRFVTLLCCFYCVTAHRFVASHSCVAFIASQPFVLSHSCVAFIATGSLRLEQLLLSMLSQQNITWKSYHGNRHFSKGLNDFKSQPKNDINYCNSFSSYSSGALTFLVLIIVRQLANLVLFQNFR